MSDNHKPKGFEQAEQTASEYAADKQKTGYLLDEAMAKAERHKKVLQGIWSDLQALLRMLKAWARGEYKQTPWRSIVFAIAGVIYFVNPFDVVPDFIPIAGFLDDATVIGFVMKSMKKDIREFLAWEQTQVTQGNEPV